MTLYLAIDAATDVGSVALGTPAALAGEIRFTERRHAAALAPAMDHLLRAAGVGYGDLAGVVVADGPGSFTGLRIAVATAQGILRGCDDLPLFAAPSLLAAAARAARWCGGPAAALYDALRGEVFAAVYEVGERGVVTHLAPLRETPETVMARCAVRPTVAVGDGAVRHAAAVRRWTGRDPVGPPEGAPSAAALLALVAVPGAVAQVEDPATFEPAYGRLAEAQVRWERAHERPLRDPGGSAA